MSRKNESLPSLVRNLVILTRYFETTEIGRNRSSDRNGRFRCGVAVRPAAHPRLLPMRAG